MKSFPSIHYEVGTRCIISYKCLRICNNSITICNTRFMHIGFIRFVWRLWSNLSRTTTALFSSFNQNLYCFVMNAYIHNLINLFSIGLSNKIVAKGLILEALCLWKFELGICIIIWFYNVVTNMLDKLRNRNTQKI